MNPQTDLEVGQEYDTAVGRVRVLSITSPAPGGHIIFEEVDSGQLSRTYTAEGFTPVPRKFKLQVWVNIYRTTGGYEVGRGTFSSHSKAIQGARLRSPVATVYVDIEGTEGDGVPQDLAP